MELEANLFYYELCDNVNDTHNVSHNFMMQ
jgi:hypothetical protein